jgi:hypothetical protein
MQGHGLVWLQNYHSLLPASFCCRQVMLYTCKPLQGELTFSRATQGMQLLHKGAICSNTASTILAGEHLAQINACVQCTRYCTQHGQYGYLSSSSSSSSSCMLTCMPVMSIAVRLQTALSTPDASSQAPGHSMHTNDSSQLVTPLVQHHTLSAASQQMKPLLQHHSAFAALPADPARTEATASIRRTALPTACAPAMPVEGMSCASRTRGACSSGTSNT